jgi:hypothetical protein
MKPLWHSLPGRPNSNLRAPASTEIRSATAAPAFIPRNVVVPFLTNVNASIAVGR